MLRLKPLVALALTVSSAISFAPGVLSSQPPGYSDWTTAINLEEIEGTHLDVNTDGYTDGCPAVSRDGRSLFLASNRPGYGNNDLWVSTRPSTDFPWGKPENLGATVNTAAAEFCPGPQRDGHRLLLVRRPGPCGAGDIYVTSKLQSGVWVEPVPLPCHPAGPNSAADEWSPNIVEYDDGRVELYFSSPRTGNGDIYVSVLQPDGTFGPGALIEELSSPYPDFRPNVRRDGLEIFFDSSQPPSADDDIWTATRPHPAAGWSAPVRLGDQVNSVGGNEHRPFLSWDGTTLYFSSTRPYGASMDTSANLYLTTRRPAHGAR